MLDATARAEDRHFWFRGLRRFAAQFLEPVTAGRPLRLVVDCGAGTGRNLDWLAALGPAVGLERSATGLSHGRRLGRRMVQGSITSLPFPSASADLVTCFDVLYCLEDADERQALAEMFRVVRPGGALLVNVAALDILRGSHSTLTHEVRRYTRATLGARLASAGFAVDRMSFTNLTTFPPTLLVRWLDRVRGRAGVPSDADLGVPPAPVNALLDAALAIEAALLRAIDLPVGSSILCLAHRPIG